VNLRSRGTVPPRREEIAQRGGVATSARVVSGIRQPKLLLLVDERPRRRRLPDDAFIRHPARERSQLLRLARIVVEGEVVLRVFRHEVEMLAGDVGERGPAPGEELSGRPASGERRELV